MKAPTLSDVALRAGVSYATADRVVNDRGGVAQKSVAKVRKALAELGYVRNVAAANLSQGRVYRFAFVVPSGPNAFFREVRSLLLQARAQLASERTTLLIAPVKAFDPDALIRLIARLEQQQLDGVAVVGSDGEGVSDALRQLAEGGVAVVTFVSDLAPEARASYVGIDNIAVGRTAARLMGLAHGRSCGLIQPIVGALSARDHRDRLAGFRDLVSECFPNLAILPEIEGLDRHERVEQRLAVAFDRHPGVTGIYSVGAGNSGLARVLARRHGDQMRPTVIVHELVPDSRRALDAGLFDIVIDQRPRDAIARALRSLQRLVDKLPAEPLDPIVPAIFVRENLPPLPRPDSRQGA